MLHTATRTTKGVSVQAARLGKNQKIDKEITARAHLTTVHGPTFVETAQLCIFLGDDFHHSL